MFCSKCGNILPDNARYCDSCGAKVERSAARSASSVNAACDHPHTVEATPSVGMVEAIRLFFTHYADFSGRSRRSEYWWIVLFSGIVSCLLSIVFHDSLAISSIWSLVTLVPSLALCVRRLHDVGKKGTFYLWILLPVAGGIILLIQMLKDSAPGANQWGVSPKYSR